MEAKRHSWQVQKSETTFASGPTACIGDLFLCVSKAFRYYEGRTQMAMQECSWVLEPGEAEVKILAPQPINCVTGQLSRKGVYKIGTVKLLGGWNEMMLIKVLCNTWLVLNVLPTLAI